MSADRLEGSAGGFDRKPRQSLSDRIESDQLPNRGLSGQRRGRGGWQREGSQGTQRRGKHIARQARRETGLGGEGREAAGRGYHFVPGGAASIHARNANGERAGRSKCAAVPATRGATRSELCARLCLVRYELHGTQSA